MTSISDSAALPIRSPNPSTKAPASLEEVTTPGSDQSAHVRPKSPQDTLLSEDPFSNQVSKSLFEAIDELRRCGAGQELDLPQLVIVGKQSAGKSSLLQSLTDIPFRVGGRLCTRFATRIISKRSPPGSTDTINISLEAGDIDNFGYPDDGREPGDFEPRSIPSMTAEVFENIVNEATEVMGITSESTPMPRHFSSMVLKIEIAGPQRSHFGILDVPGIFSAATNRITTQEMEGVKSMVTSYMRQPQNIIICVADATDDLANQQIFTMAADLVDPANLVGVLAKCDRTQHPEAIVELVNNRDSIAGRPLHHGWYVVRNSGPNEPSSFDREAEETSLFSQSPWNAIPESRRGTSKLKHFLANLLCRRIREAFPGMQDTVSEKLRIEDERLMSLGNPRPDFTHQQAHLIEVVRNFNNFAMQALKSPADLESNDLKLRGMVHKANKEFVDRFKEHGHLYPFSDIEEYKRNGIFGEALDDSKGSGTSMFGSNVDTRQRKPPTPETTPSRTNRSTRKVPISPPRTIHDEIRDQIEANRGEELAGMINPAVLKSLMRKQASRWQELAEAHFLYIVKLTIAVGDGILDLACSQSGASDRTKQGFAEMIAEFGKNLEDRAVIEISRVCYKDTKVLLQTNNPQFLENVKKSRLLRFKTALERFYDQRRGFSEKVDLFLPFGVVNEAPMQGLFEQIHPSCTQNTEIEIHDILKAYYDVAREDFIQHITHHIIEPFLWHSDGPLMGLSTELILSLPTEKVEDLGGEDENVIACRQETSEKIRRLEAAMRIARETLRKTRVVVAETS